MFQFYIYATLILLEKLCYMKTNRNFRDQVWNRPPTNSWVKDFILPHISCDNALATQILIILIFLTHFESMLCQSFIPFVFLQFIQFAKLQEQRKHEIFKYYLKMRLDLKKQDKSLKEMKRVSSLVNRQGKFHFTKNELFHNFCKDIAHIFESLFECLQRGILNPRHIKNWSSF